VPANAPGDRWADIYLERF